MSHDIVTQLLAAAAWAATEPAYEHTARLLRYLARHVAAGALDLSGLPPQREGEGAWAGVIRRLRTIGVDVIEMCGEEVSA